MAWDTYTEDVAKLEELWAQDGWQPSADIGIPFVPGEQTSLLSKDELRAMKTVVPGRPEKGRLHVSWVDRHGSWKECRFTRYHAPGMKYGYWEIDAFPIGKPDDAEEE